ncbi:MAG: 4Fe-4S dicluster domain-containing protein [Proteobacteria bacterium]|nr:4Fe-4S dicluster domain-containing protein [Pseudomonadota bacterium]
MEKIEKHVDDRRRNFLKKLVLGSGMAILSAGFLPGCIFRDGTGAVWAGAAAIVVDYEKCTGCRTCEAVCSSFYRYEKNSNTAVPGLGNPHFANIRVYSFNPDMDIPLVCSFCRDAPCIRECPVPEDENTGKKALFRDKKTGAVTLDPSRCIGCGSCKDTCEKESAGVIRLDSEPPVPHGICNLCNGSPMCVKHCPFDALSFEKKNPDYPYDKMVPEKIAQELIRTHYRI